MSRELKLAVGSSRFQKTWSNQKQSWGQLLALLTETDRTSETVAEYHGLPKAKQAEIKDVGGFVGGHLAKGSRKRASVLSRSMLTLDLDYCDSGTLTVLDILVDWEAAIYSTHKHTPKEPRLRLVIPLARDVSAEEYEPLGRMVASQLGIDVFDDTTFEAHRLMYWPSTPSDGEYIFERIEGPWLDPDELLAKYDNWRDVTTWPTSKRQERAQQASLKAQVDPTTKDGLVGAFCRTYSLSEAIETFLGGVYAPTGAEDRYDYVPGESSSGVVVYDDKWSYSHHSTDPAGGVLVNAFDLVRLHRFADLDADVKEGTPSNRLPSYTAMLDLARGDDATRAHLSAEKIADATADFEVVDPDWMKRLTYDRKGRIESTLPNAALILENDPELAGLAFDELWGAIAVRSPLPWPTHGYWRDADDAHLALYIESRYARFTKQDLVSALAAVTDGRRFHPVLDYLEGLPKWDGVRRVDSLLIDYLGAEDAVYTRAVTRKLLCAAVRRVKRPGCKFDTMLVLAGPQGVGKSTLVAKLGMGWFNDTLTMLDTRDKTAAEKLQGFWFQEFGELSGMRKTEVEAMRSFISRQDDVYRGAYDRRVSRHPRQCVFIGTTNAENGFLTDPAGNRRFWPVDAPGSADQKPWDLDQHTVDQIWAETLILEAAGERLFLEGDLAREAAERQREAIEVDERTGVVREYLERLLPQGWEALGTFERRGYLEGSEFGPVAAKGCYERSQVSVVEVWCECFGKPKGDLSRRESYAITNMLRSLGWENNRKSVRIYPYGKQKVFERQLEVEPNE